MLKATKKKPMGKAVAAALKAMQNMVFETADRDVQLRQMKEILGPAGINVGFGVMVYAARTAVGFNVVGINVGSSSISTDWPEWAYGVAEGAVHFNKQVLLVYNNDVPSGANILFVGCLS